MSECVCVCVCVCDYFIFRAIFSNDFALLCIGRCLSIPEDNKIARKLIFASTENVLFE